MAKSGPPEPLDFPPPGGAAGVEAEVFPPSRGELNKETGEVQVNSLLCSMGMDAEPSTVRLCKDEQIRDRIAIGILDNEVPQRLQLEADLTLERATQLARQSEQVKRRSAERVETGVNEVRHKQYGNTRRSCDNSRQPPGQQHGDAKQNCQRCNRVHDNIES